MRAARIPLPEDSESFDAKVKRHRQVLQTEADEAAGMNCNMHNAVLSELTNVNATENVD